MADILIRMEMPKTCADCHDADLPTAIAWLGAKCPWANGIIDPGVYDLRHERHPDSPLHELPEHGDLIDRSELNNSFESSDFDGEPYDNVYSAICVVNSMPVIVPSNKETTE